MIYRLFACQLLGAFGFLLLLATALANQMAAFGPRRREASPFWPTLISALLRLKAAGVLMGALVVATLFFLWPAIVEYLSTRTVHMHWSRLIAGTFTLFAMLQTAVFAVLMKVITIWQRERSFGAATDPILQDASHAASQPALADSAARQTVGQTKRSAAER